MEKINMGLITLNNAISMMKEEAEKGGSFIMSFEDKRTGFFHKIEYSITQAEIKTEKDGSKWKRIYE